MSYTEKEDGSRVYPKFRNQEPPSDIPGFERDPQDQYRFIPILPECTHRFNGSYTTSCCGQVIKFYVCKKGHPVNQAECLKCIRCGRRDSST